MGYSDPVQKYVVVWVFHKVVIRMLAVVLKSRANLSTLLRVPWSSCLEKRADKTEQSLSSILEFQASLESKG